MIGGTPLAYLLARRVFRGRAVVAALMDLPLVIPHPVAGIALLLVLGRGESGRLRARTSAGLRVAGLATGIVCAMLFVSAPLYVSAAREAFARVDARYESVARTLGDDAWRAFRRVTLPLAARGLTAAAVVMWARAVSEFGAIVILTYNPKVASVLELRPLHELRAERSAAGRRGARAVRARSARRAPRACARRRSARGRMIALEHVMRARGKFSSSPTSVRRFRTAATASSSARRAQERRRCSRRSPGVIPLTSGRILLDGDDVTSLPPEAARRRHRLSARLSVSASRPCAQNIAYGAARCRDAANDIAERFGVGVFADRAIGSLSGGERQLVALARALARRPSVLLLDEPFSALDPRTSHAARRALRALYQERRFTVLQVTHDFAEAGLLGDVAIDASTADASLQQGDPERSFAIRRRRTSPTSWARRMSLREPCMSSPRIRDGSRDDVPTRRRVHHDCASRFTRSATFSPEPRTPSFAPRRSCCPSRCPPSSMQNHFAGRVIELLPNGPLTDVTVDVNGTPIVAAITARSVPSSVSRSARSRRELQDDRGSSLLTCPSVLRMSRVHRIPRLSHRAAVSATATR